MVTIRYCATAELRELDVLITVNMMQLRFDNNMDHGERKTWPRVVYAPCVDEVTKV